MVKELAEMVRGRGRSLSEMEGQRRSEKRFRKETNTEEREKEINKK